MTPSFQQAESLNFNASGTLPIGDGYLQGLVCSSSSSGTLTLVDGKSRTIVNAMPLVAGQAVLLFGARYIGSLTATIGGTANVTLMYVN